MNYNKLKYFYEVSKVRNLSRAAELLYISQPSLSKAISDLEKDFGTPLFIRTNRNLVLTSAGLVLQKKIAAFFDSEQDIISCVRAAAAPVSHAGGKIDIDLMTFDKALYVNDFSRSFINEYPNIDINIKRSQKKDIIKKMEDHSTDIAFLIFAMDDFYSDYEYKILDEHHLSLIVRCDHPLASREAVDISEIRNDPIIAHGHKKNSNEYAYTYGWATRNGLRPNIVAEYDYVETVLMQVSAGAGVTILSDAAPIDAFANLANVPLTNAPIVYTGIFWNSKKSSALTELFVQSFIDSLN